MEVLLTYFLFCQQFISLIDYGLPCMIMFNYATQHCFEICHGKYILSYFPPVTSFDRCIRILNTGQVPGIFYSIQGLHWKHLRFYVFFRFSLFLVTYRLYSSSLLGIVSRFVNILRNTNKKSQESSP